MIKSVMAIAFIAMTALAYASFNSAPSAYAMSAKSLALVHETGSQVVAKNMSFDHHHHHDHHHHDHHHHHHHHH